MLIFVTRIYFPYVEPSLTLKTKLAGESWIDGNETLAKNPETSLLISREMLRVKSGYDLIVHSKNPGLFLSR